MVKCHRFHGQSVSYLASLHCCLTWWFYVNEDLHNVFKPRLYVGPFVAFLGKKTSISSGIHCTKKWCYPIGKRQEIRRKTSGNMHVAWRFPADFLTFSYWITSFFRAVYTAWYWRLFSEERNKWANIKTRLKNIMKIFIDIKSSGQATVKWC